MFDNNDGMSACEKRIESLKEFADIVEMEPCGRFVEDKECRFFPFLPDEIGQFHALVFATRKGGGALSEFDISKSHILQGAESLGYFSIAGVGKKCDIL